jgi:NAD(P)-dependent dehydrogenase (short-subunit alcohol dehydrogenase family)
MATVSVVTGANSGIGRATALRLASEGHRVYGTMRSLDKGDKLAQRAGELGVEVHPVELDVADTASVQRGLNGVLADAGRIDVLVNNAGVGLNATVEDLDLAEAQAVMDTNVWGAVRCAQVVLPQMRERGDGHIVNVSSVAGRIAAIGQAAYTASKWALEAISEEMAQELALFGVKVSIIEPGVTRTAIFPKNTGHPSPTAYDAAYRRMFQFYAKGIPAASPPEEVADVVVQAINADPPRLRWACAWGGVEITGGRTVLADEAWVDLGSCADDEDYYDGFAAAFGLDLRT